MWGHVLATDAKIPKVGFGINEEDLPIQSWVDNWDVHRRFADLYKRSDGESPFWRNPVRLDMEDVLLLEYETLKSKKSPEEKYDISRFSRVARKYLDQGRKVYYYGSW